MSTPAAGTAVARSVADLLGAALAYTALGWHPIPLCWPDAKGECGCGRGHRGKDVGKAPLLGPGWQCIRPGERDVVAWWRRWPSANIGILLEVSGLLVLDLDSQESLREALGLGLPPGPVATSGKGEHRYYQTPKGVSGRAARQGTSKALDILAAGFVVVPPSRHRNGRRYEWLLRPEESPPQEAPAWAVALLRERLSALQPQGEGEPFPQCRGTRHTAHLPEVELADLRVSERIRRLIAEGDRDARYPSRSEALFAAVTALVGAGCDDATIMAAIWQNPIGAKAREQGLRWLWSEIARARQKSRSALAPQGTEEPFPQRRKRRHTISVVIG